MLTQFFFNRELIMTKKDCMPLPKNTLIIIKEEKSPYDETAYLVQDNLLVFSEGETRRAYTRVYLREIIHPEERN